VSIDTFIAEIENRKKNDLADLDKKLNDKKSETEGKKNSAVKELKENYANEAKTKAEREGARIVEAGKLEAKKILFDAINKNLDSTFDVIKKELEGYSKKPEYKKVLQKLVDYSKKTLAKKIIIHCRDEDKSSFKATSYVRLTLSLSPDGSMCKRSNRLQVALMASRYSVLSPTRVNRNRKMNSLL